MRGGDAGAIGRCGRCVRTVYSGGAGILTLIVPGRRPARRRLCNSRRRPFSRSRRSLKTRSPLVRPTQAAFANETSASFVGSPTVSATRQIVATCGTRLARNVMQREPRRAAVADGRGSCDRIVIAFAPRKRSSWISEILEFCWLPTRLCSGLSPLPRRDTSHGAARPDSFSRAHDFSPHRASVAADRVALERRAGPTAGSRSRPGRVTICVARHNLAGAYE